MKMFIMENMVLLEMFRMFTLPIHVFGSSLVLDRSLYRVLRDDSTYKNGNKLIYWVT